MTQIRRRHFVAATAAIFVAGVQPSLAAGAAELVHMSWGGLSEENMRKAFWDPFTKETGVSVAAISPVSLAKLAAQEKIKQVEIDVFDGGSIETWRGQRQGLLTPIDWSVVGKEGRAKDEVNEYGLRFMALSNQIVYNTDKYAAGKGPESLAEFWDVERFPGRRGLYKDPRTAIQFALLADGIPRDKLWPLDVDRAFKSLDRIKQHIAVWWEQGNQSQQLFANGELDMMQMWNGRATDLKQKGAPIHQVWTDGIIGLSAINVAKNAPNVTDAMRLVEYFGRSAPQAEWARLMAYGPMNPKAFTHIDDAIGRTLPTYPDNYRVQVVSDDEWWGANWDSINERFKGWLVS